MLLSRSFTWLPITLLTSLVIVIGFTAIAVQRQHTSKTVALPTLSSSPQVAASSTAPDHPLIQKSNLTSLGSFRLATGGSFFSYPARAMAFYRDGAGKKTLFLSGHTWYQKIGQVEIPATLSKSDNWNTLPPAPVLQNPVDVTEGNLTAGINPNYLGGALTFNGRLIVAGYVGYDGNGEQRLSHGASSFDLSKTGDFQGFYQLTNPAHARTKGGYMGLIPPEWQELLGGPALTGNCCLNIISTTSSGPAAHVFNPDDIGVKNPVPAIPLMYNTYPISNCANQSSEFNCTTAITGIAFPQGTNSVLFFGTQGTGPNCYKCDGAGGYWAPPYHAQVWAFDAAELLKVKQGEKTPQSVKPYAVWQMDDVIGTPVINAAAYDPVEQRLYIESNGAESPTVTVVQIDTSIAAISAATPTPTPTPTPTATPTPTPTSNPQITNLTQTVAENSVTFTWQTTSPLSLRLDFALADDFKKPLTVTSPEGTNHSIKLTDVVPCTIYRFRLASLSDPSQTTAKGKFTTTGCVGKAAIQDEATDTVNAKQGGKVGLGNKVQLEAPANFATEDTNFQIKQLDRAQAQTAADKPAGLNSLSNWYQIQALKDPSALTASFNQPLSITLSYTVDDSVPADSIKAYRYDGAAWEALSNCTTNQANHTITCPLDHFSVFGVFGGGSFTSPTSTPTPTPTSIPTPTQTPPPVSSSAGSGGSGAGGGGGGGGGSSSSSSEAAVGKTYTYQAEKGKLAGPVIAKDGQATVIIFSLNTDRASQLYNVAAGTYRLSFLAKDGLPTPTKVAIYLNGKVWKTITLRRGDNQYHEIIAGSLKGLRTGTIAFRLVTPLPNQTLALDWWRLTQVK